MFFFVVVFFAVLNAKVIVASFFIDTIMGFWAGLWSATGPNSALVSLP